MNHRAEAGEIHRHGELCLPDEDARNGHQHHADRHPPEHHLLAAVVLPGFRHVVVVTVDHFLRARQPFAVGVRHLVQLVETQEQEDEEEGHEDADVRVQDARPGTPAEQLRQREERRVEEGQAGKGEEDERDTHYPVVRPFARIVTLQIFRIADHCASSFSISFSISFETSFGPFIT